MRREHQFAGMKREDWDRIILEEADHFICCRFMNRRDETGSKFAKRKHANILEAVKDAAQDIAAGRRAPLIYAVNGIGHDVLVPQAQWTALIREFAARHPDYEA